jgi:glycosyltransferase involved in cell wall biosynthesis
MPHVFVAGYPSTLGGANTELWHTLKLWRSGGIDVTCLVLKGEPEQEWVDRVAGIGCRTVFGRLDSLDAIPHLPGATVVAFCNHWFLQELHQFDKLGCKYVWVPCMNWPFPQQQLIEQFRGMLDAYVFQSEYQAAQMMPLTKNSCERGEKPYLPERFHQIRGAFDVEEFPFRPKPVVEGEPFVIGRLSRSVGKPANVPALEKYPRDLWAQYAAIRARIPHLKARVMGWCAGIEEKCGPPPEWAEVLPDCAETAQEFLASLHCLVPGIGCTPENWPRVGLEAMSAGVPLVVERKGGWVEMSERSAVDRSMQITELRQLAEPEWHTVAAGFAHGAVIALADPESILPKWQAIFNELET